jgi:hypothetical protein
MRLTVINTGNVPIEQPVMQPGGVPASVIVNPGKVTLPEGTLIVQSVSSKITIKDQNNKIYVPGAVHIEDNFLVPVQSNKTEGK